MIVYKRKIHFDYDYPEDMKLIFDYLNEHGEVLVEGNVIESLYREFSSEKYEAGWMSIDEQMLIEFEDWLEHYDRPRWR